MKTQIIAIVGMAGAGKSEAAAFFKSQGLPVLRFGEETDIGLKELGKEINQQNERWYREKLRRELGMAAYAIRIKPRLDATLKKHSRVILDGLYSWEEYLYLKKYFDNLILLCIYATPKTRYARLLEREVRPLGSSSEAYQRDVAELEKLNKGGPIAIADYLVINERPLSRLNDELQQFLNSLK